MATTRIGTSGWSFPDWRPAFYPAGLAKTKWLKHYASVFSTVEVNSTFYGVPREFTLRSWVAQSPADFVFTLKAPRSVTHEHKIAVEAIQAFAEQSRLLGSRRGPLLYQWPPWQTRDMEYLAAFVGSLPHGFDHVIEFRHASWYTQKVKQYLKKAQGKFLSTRHERECDTPLGNRRRGLSALARPCSQVSRKV